MRFVALQLTGDRAGIKRGEASRLDFGSGDAVVPVQPAKWIKYRAKSAARLKRAWNERREQA